MTVGTATALTGIVSTKVCSSSTLSEAATGFGPRGDSAPWRRGAVLERGDVASAAGFGKVGPAGALAMRMDIALRGPKQTAQSFEQRAQLDRT